MSSPGKPSSQQRSKTWADAELFASSPTYLEQTPEAAVLPEGPGALTEEAVELLHEFVHPHHHLLQSQSTGPPSSQEQESHIGRRKRSMTSEATLANGQDEDESDGGSVHGGGWLDLEDWEDLKARPWYRRPSPLWLLCFTPLTAMAMSACIAPRVEIFTLLACMDKKPEYMWHGHHGVDGGDKWTTGPGANSGGFNSMQLETMPAQIVDYSSISPIATTVTVLDAFMHPRPKSPEIEAEESRTDKCASDPVVAAAAARIIAVLTIFLGTLSCLTTGFWGQFSDQNGRTRTLRMTVFGTFMADLIFISVYFFWSRFPGGYWFLLVGAFCEGITGGAATLSATLHSYYADCTDPGSRARVFALGLGLMFAGTGIGPTVGAALGGLTHNPLSPFFFALSVHATFFLYVSLAVPESLPAKMRLMNRTIVLERQTQLKSDRGLLSRFKQAFSFLRPLAELAPARVPVEGSQGLKTTTDWSLTFIAMCFAFSALVISSYQYKFQYIQMKFHWTSKELGYLLTGVGTARALFLVAILPAIIKYFNPPRTVHKQSVDAQDSEPLMPLESTQTTDSLSLLSSNAPHPPRKQHVEGAQLAPHSVKFDLWLCRVSLAFDSVCYSVMALIPSAVTFVTTGILLSFGGGLNPAIQALALELYVRRNKKTNAKKAVVQVGKEDEVETGRLFAALSVISSISSSILGPALFGFIFIETVGTVPIAIFWASTSCTVISLIFICLVRLPRTRNDSQTLNVSQRSPSVSTEDSEGPRALQREDTLVDTSSSAIPGANTTRRAHTRQKSYGSIA